MSYLGRKIGAGRVDYTVGREEWGGCDGGKVVGWGILFDGVEIVVSILLLKVVFCSHEVNVLLCGMVSLDM